MISETQIIAFPTIRELNRIISQDRIDIISPFYSRWALAKLAPTRHSKIRFITRLPTTYSSPPPFLDNDPRPLKESMSRLGSALSVYALPHVHAKLYLNPLHAWLGSANFTRTGFSGIGELLMCFNPPLEELRSTFDHFKTTATRVTEENLQYLVENVRSGLTRLSPHLDTVKDSGDASIETTASYEDFKKWIEARRGDEIAAYISSRSHNKYRMSGHVYSGFHGTFIFLRDNQDIARELLKIRRLPIPERILNELSPFVERYGDKFGGPRGGTWRSKLSVRLGGVHTHGGAGDVMVKRLLIEVPRYMRYKRLL
jgi:hypothetical protein